MLRGEDGVTCPEGTFTQLFLVFFVLPFCLLLHYVFFLTDFTERRRSPGKIRRGRKVRSESTFFVYNCDYRLLILWLAGSSTSPTTCL